MFIQIMYQSMYVEQHWLRSMILRHMERMPWSGTQVTKLVAANRTGHEITALNEMLAFQLVKNIPQSFVSDFDSLDKVEN